MARSRARIHRRFENAVGGRHRAPSTPFKEANDVSSGAKSVTAALLAFEPCVERYLREQLEEA